MPVRVGRRPAGPINARGWMPHLAPRAWSVHCAIAAERALANRSLPVSIEQDTCRKGCVDATLCLPFHPGASLLAKPCTYLARIRLCGTCPGQALSSAERCLAVFHA